MLFQRLLESQRLNNYASNYSNIDIVYLEIILTENLLK
jgi:hypothetical protein